MARVGPQRHKKKKMRLWATMLGELRFQLLVFPSLALSALQLAVACLMITLADKLKYLNNR